MAQGGIDLYQSRRTTHTLCYYWKKLQGDRVSANELNYNKKNLAGIFYAQEITPQFFSNNTYGNNFMFENCDLTLKTNDEITNLKSNDIVKYDDKYWIVVSVQKKRQLKESQFSKNPSNTFYIALRK